MSNEKSVMTRTRVRKTGSDVRVTSRTTAKPRKAKAALSTAAPTTSTVGAAVSSPPVPMASAAPPPPPPPITTKLQGAWIIEIVGSGETLTGDLSNLSMGRILSIGYNEICQASLGHKIGVNGNPDEAFEVLAFNEKARTITARLKEGTTTMDLGYAATNALPHAGANLILAPHTPRGRRTPPPRKSGFETNILGVEMR